MTAANADLAAEVEQLRAENDTQRGERDAALDQQTAMATVLSAVARAGSDADPVLFDIAEQAGRLLESESGGLVLFNGDVSTRFLMALNRPFIATDLAVGQTYTQVAPNRVHLVSSQPRSAVLRERNIMGKMLVTAAPVQVWGSRADILARYPDMAMNEGWPEPSRGAQKAMASG